MFTPDTPTWLDYEFVHDSYDGAPDSNDKRCGRARSLQEAMEQIDELEDGPKPRRIPEGNMAGLEDAFAKLARRAEKLGLVAPKLVKLSELDVLYKRLINSQEPRHLDWWEVKDGEAVDESKYETHYRRFFMCVVEGEAPVLNGWELISVIDHTTDPEIGNLIKDVPGKETPIQYRKAEPLCQHCNSKRRRHETFLLLKDGEYKQVGRNCLADFCRSPEAAQGLVNSAEFLFRAMGLLGEAEESDSYEGGRTGESYYNIVRILSLAHSFIKKIGWTSGKTASEREGLCSTANLVGSTTWPNWRKNATKEEKEAFDECGERDQAIAEAALEWIRAKKPEVDTLNDYLYNLLVVCSQDRIPRKYFGLACSLIPTHLRELDQMIEREKKAALPPSEHFGTIKKREVFELTVTGSNSFQGTYGVTTFIRFVDKNGNVAIWKASGERDDLERGKAYFVKATVKEHGEYKGTKQTVLTRCDYEPVEPEPPETAEEYAQRAAAEQNSLVEVEF
jgi:hypothetical protein